MDDNTQAARGGQFYALQAAHSVAVHSSHYGNDIDLRHGMTDSVLAALPMLDVAQLPDKVSLNTASSHKRLPWVPACRFVEKCGRGRPSSKR